ncbi:MAG: outer membrane protein transport protein [Alistipes sp.]|nr:outer membrane protein transport protein [Alistipes sp.]
MQVKNTLNRLLVAALLSFVPAVVSAQTSSINAFSPYTMYGIGELTTPGSLAMRSMGGAGVAMRNPGALNMLNPAAFSAVPQKSFLFGFGLEGQNFYNSQSDNGVTRKSAYNTFNFHDIAFQLPVHKRVGLGFSMTPYSSVGYRTKFYGAYDPEDPVWGNVGPVQYSYEGEGDVTEIKLGVGWEVAKNLSVGIAAQYYWGKIERSYVVTPTSIVGDGNFNSIVGSGDYVISRFKGQVGVQWNAILNSRRALTFGATYDLGGDLRPRSEERIYTSDLSGTVVKGDSLNLKLVLPGQVAAGAYYQTARWAVALDYVYQNWGGRNKETVRTAIGTSGESLDVAYTDTHTVKFGVEFTPSRYDARNFLKRWSYRAGFRYGSYNQTFGGHELHQYAVSLGFGIPVRFFGSSSIDVGVEYGCRGFNVAERIGLVRQRYFKFAVGFALFAGSENGEYWFVRPKYD